jgi:hypothetical protein
MALFFGRRSSRNMFAGHDETTVWGADPQPAVQEPGDDSDHRHEVPADVRLDADDRTLEEAGYGYGV